ncbi:hypothetical protein ACWEBX_33610 [Streptomyces sp. NPDC005070]
MTECTVIGVPSNGPSGTSANREKTIVPVGAGSPPTSKYRPDRPNPYRARVRWFDPATKRRLSLSEGKADEDEAQEWLQDIIEAGLAPSLATMKLAEYGDANMDLALRGMELKTLDPSSRDGGCAWSPPWATSPYG